MAPTEPDLDLRLGTLFVALDDVPAGPEFVVGSLASRERYESLVTFAFRKLEAARHHLVNVERLLSSEQAEFEEASTRHVSHAGGGRASRRTTTVRMLRSADRYAFELSAFVSAIKSGLDFLATVAAMHLPGITADSIAVLMKQVSKGVGGPILDEVAVAKPWLSAIRDYRHHLIHRLVIRPSVGWTVTTQGGATAAARIPVVVPERTPTYVPDTRRARMMEEDVPLGTMERRSFGSVTYPGGTSKVLKHELAYEPTSGHMAIEVFMTRHLTSFEDFFAAMIDALVALDFKRATLTKPGSPVAGP